MTKSLDRDLSLKLRLRRVLFSQGYWCPIEVELSHYEHLGTSVKRQSLTDLDVLGLRFDELFTPHRVVGDCKSGRHVSDANRLFWLRGVMDFFGADQAYILRPRLDAHARAIAPKMGLRVMDETELTRLEKTVGADAVGIPLADPAVHREVSSLWGIDVPRGQKPTGDQLVLKGVYSHLAYSYWYIEPSRRLLTLVGQFESAAHLLKSADPRHVLLAHIGAERLGHCLLDLASHVQAQGAADVPRYARIYLYGGPLGLKDKERFFELLRKATGTAEQLDPSWLPDILELLGRFLRNPAGACDVLRQLMALYLWCAHLGNSSPPELDPGSPNTAALVLAKDVAFTFAKVAGLSEGLFGAIKSL